MTENDNRLRRSGAYRTKCVLYCPVCGHESPIDGDWRTEHTTTRDGGRVVYSCPDCEHAVTTRPDHEPAVA